MDNITDPSSCAVINWRVRCARHTVQGHERRILRPMRWRRPHHVRVVDDLFDGSFSEAVIERVFDVMWRCPQHTFFVLTKNPEQMCRYFRQNRSKQDWSWLRAQLKPIAPFDVLSFQELRGYNVCGYVSFQRPCTHPKHYAHNAPGAAFECHTRCCPISHTADQEILREVGIEQQHRYNEHESAPDRDLVWMHRRPRLSLPGNVCLGFAAADQGQFEERVRQFSWFRRLSFHTRLFCTFESLHTPIDFEIDNSPLESRWNTLNSVNSLNPDIRYIDYVFVGPKAADVPQAAYSNWVRNIAEQCFSAGVMFSNRPVGVVSMPKFWPRPRQLHRIGMSLDYGIDPFDQLRVDAFRYWNHPKQKRPVQSEWFKSWLLR